MGHNTSQYSDSLQAGKAGDCGGEISAPIQTSPGAQMGTRSFPGIKWQGHGINHRPSFSIKVKGRVQLHLYSPFVPWHEVMGWSFTCRVQEIKYVASRECSWSSMMKLAQRISNHCTTNTLFYIHHTHVYCNTPMVFPHCQCSHTLLFHIYTIKVNVKWSHYRPGVAQRVGRGIALLFHDRSTTSGWVVSSTSRPHFSPGKEQVPILEEAGWAPGPVWMDGKSQPHWDSIPDHPAHSQSLYWLN